MMRIYAQLLLDWYHQHFLSCHSMFQLLDPWKDQVSNNTSLSFLVHDNDYVGNPPRTTLNQMTLFKKSPSSRPHTRECAEYSQPLRINKDHPEGGRPYYTVKQWFSESTITMS